MRTNNKEDKNNDHAALLLQNFHAMIAAFHITPLFIIDSLKKCLTKRL